MERRGEEKGEEEGRGGLGGKEGGYKKGGVGSGRFNWPETQRKPLEARELLR